MHLTTCLLGGCIQDSLKGSLLPVTNKYGLIGSTATALMLTLALPRCVRSCRWSAATDAQIRCQINYETKTITLTLLPSVCYYCTQLVTTVLCCQQQTCTKLPKLILCSMGAYPAHLRCAFLECCLCWLALGCHNDAQCHHHSQR